MPHDHPTTDRRSFPGSARIAAALLLVSGCALLTGSDSLENEPMWVQELVAEFKAAPVANPPLSIALYSYRNEQAYFVPGTCCDGLSSLYDVAGAVICHPDGGFTGAGDGRCTDFRTASRRIRTVWQDSRSYPSDR